MRRCHSSLSLKDHLEDDGTPVLDDRFLERKDNGLCYNDTLTNGHEPLSFTMDTYFDENTRKSTQSGGAGSAGGSVHEEVGDELSPEEIARKSPTASFIDNHLVTHMWDNFSLNDYTDDPRISGNRRPRSSSTPRKKAWTPVITIPKPFAMTRRDEEKKEK